MKKLFYLLLVLLPFNGISQINDSINQSMIEQGLNVLVIEPSEDPNGAQARPCGSFVTAYGACCHRYEVICGGVIKWASDMFCNKFCLAGQILGELNQASAGYLVPTEENPATADVPFDVSLIIDKEVLTKERIEELKKEYSVFYFVVEDDIVIDNGGSYVVYKRGNYTINKGVMAVKYYHTQSVD
jgi:hypothetical protein